MTHRVALALVSALPTLGLLAACTSTATPRDSAPASPSSSTARPPTARPALTSEQVVDHPGSTLVSLVASPTDLGVRATVWQLLPNSGRRALFGVAVTGDGFRTRTVPDLPTRAPGIFLSAGHGFFVVSSGSRPRWVLTPGGTLTDIATIGPPSPLASGEVVVRTGHRYAAVAVTGEIHRVRTPRRTLELRQDPSGRLRGWRMAVPQRRPQYVWSVDGGSTWRRLFLPGDSSMASLLATRGAEHLVVETTDGATLLPVDAFLSRRRPDESWSVTPGPRDPVAYAQRGARLPDGRLVLWVDGWSDQRRHGVGTPAGLYSVDPESGTWSRLEQGRPFDDLGGYTPLLVELRPTVTGVSVIASGRDNRSAYHSTDLGRTWKQLAVR